MANRNFKFETNCVASDGESISAMQEAARQITRRTFLAYVDRDSLYELEKSFGYERHPSQGLTMARDWHVGYYKSKYQGRPCVYVDHSRIEYIFTEGA